MVVVPADTNEPVRCPLGVRTPSCPTVPTPPTPGDRLSTLSLSNANPATRRQVKRHLVRCQVVAAGQSASVGLLCSAKSAGTRRRRTCRYCLRDNRAEVERSRGGILRPIAARTNDRRSGRNTRPNNE
uniref:Uncharacterized protein n=1 Tax=Plectus sambesii TaxID=2011161 RepID=A0A914WS38_9BILA